MLLPQVTYDSTAGVTAAPGAAAAAANLLVYNRHSLTQPSVLTYSKGLTTCLQSPACYHNLLPSSEYQPLLFCCCCSAAVRYVQVAQALPNRTKFWSSNNFYHEVVPAEQTQSIQQQDMQYSSVPC